MEALDISEISLGNDGFEAIATCVKNIKELWIANGNNQKSDFIIKGIRALSREILNRCRPVSYQLDQTALCIRPIIFKLNIHQDNVIL